MTEKKKSKGLLISLIVLALITAVIILSGGCGCNQYFTMANLTSQPPSPVEVYHFHKTHQCYTCTVLGELAEETVNTSFVAERNDGRLIFAHINIDLLENAQLVSQFGANTSSLMIGFRNETGFHVEKQTSLWKILGDKGAFMNELRNTLNERLGTNN